MLDRGGLTAPDGPTHHGTFDIAYMRIFPNMVVMTPGDANDIGAMLDFAMSQDSPCSLRYPKTEAAEITRDIQPVELGKAEVLNWGDDGIILCAGTQLEACLEAAEELLKEGLEVGVVNARFVKPLDREIIRRAIQETGFVVTVEEGMLMGGYGSAVLEAANEMQLNTTSIYRLGIPDTFVEHGTRPELLAEMKIDSAGIAATCRQASVETKSKSANNQIV